jgi:hypothetical protein
MTEYQYHWRITIRLKQKENSMCLFGAVFNLPRYCNYYEDALMIAMWHMLCILI